MQSIRGSVRIITEADIVIAIDKDFKMSFVKNRYYSELPINMQFDAAVCIPSKNSLGIIRFLILKEKVKND